MDRHWAAKYVQLKHKTGGRDCDGVDCYGLVKLVYKEEFGIELPEFTGIDCAYALSLSEKQFVELEQGWKEIGTPVDGCVVAMSQKTRIHHVGLWIGSARTGQILHCWNSERMIVDTLYRLYLKGFKVIKFYTRYGLCNRNTKSL